MEFVSNFTETAHNPMSRSRRRHRRSRRKRLLAMSLALTMPVLRVSRVAGEDNEVGYRKSYYQEDDNRINVSTDIWRFDVGLNDNIRAEGEVVVDAISGATPLGAPPQTKWPFVTFNKLYQSAYQSAYNSAYTTSYNQNQSIIALGIPGYDYNWLTNTATQAALSQAPGIATNSAAAAYHSLTNNPNYRGTKVPVTQLHDHRNAFSLQLPMTFGQQQITPSFAYSCESDYISFGGALNYSLALNNKNTTLSAGWAHNDDTVRDDQFNWQAKMTDDAFLGLVQLFGPKAYLTVNASLSFEHGYLADPYRGVMFADEMQSNPNDPALSPEVRPRHRNSQVLYASWTQFVTPLNSSYEASYRFFHDSYGIFANTVELAWHQKIGKHLVFSPIFRYYVQNAADFYYTIVPVNNGIPSFYSSDYRLSEMETFATGFDLTWRVYKHLSIDLSYMRYIMQGLDGATSQSAYPDANVVSIGARVWF